MGDRHTFRADWLDYNEGIFFITICALNKRHLFGFINDGIMHENSLGKLTHQKILDMPNHHTGLELHNAIVMPNHVHLLLQLLPVGTRPVASPPSHSVVSPSTLSPKQNFGCLKGPKHGTPKLYNHFNSRLAVIIGGFKAAVTREWRKLILEEKTDGIYDGWDKRTRQVASLRAKIWQPRFHDHYVRDQRAYDNIYNYIELNAQNWAKDCFFK